MQVKVHYLNWDKAGSENDKAMRIYKDSLVGLQKRFEKQYYRTYEGMVSMEACEIEDDESFLDIVFDELGLNQRINQLKERYLCAGDVIEYHKKRFIVWGLGFEEL